MELNFWAIGLTVLNAAWWLSNLVGLPGNWLMIAGAGLLAWLQKDSSPFGPWTLGAAGALAVVGELLEFLTGYLGARRGGGSKQAAGLALVGGILGGLAGLAIPLPVIGPLLGACLGAAVGAFIGESRQGTAFHPALRSGAAAGAGRLLGTVAKFALGGAIWLILAVAAVAK